MPKYETHWKDFNSPLCRNEIWAGLSYFWPKIFKLPYVKVGIFSEKTILNILWIWGRQKNFRQF
jgi:hypothetical protein